MPFHFSQYSPLSAPCRRMRGQKLLLPVVLMSVMLSFSTIQTSHGHNLADEPCTVQILVPGLKGKRCSTHTRRGEQKGNRCPGLHSRCLALLGKTGEPGDKGQKGAPGRPGRVGPPGQMGIFSALTTKADGTSCLSELEGNVRP